jgi:hypothetical protein
MSDAARRSPRLRAVVAVLLAVLLAGILAACDRKPQAPPPGSGSSWPSGETRVLVAGPTGLVTLSASTSVSDPTIRVGAVSAGESSGDPRSPLRGDLLAVLDGWGAVSFGLEVSGSGIVMSSTPSALFGGLRIGGAWPGTEGFLVQTFRDPFGDEPSPGMKAQTPRPGLAWIDRQGIRDAQPGFLGGAEGRGLELFAFLPDPGLRGAWLAQLRSSTGESVKSEYLALSDSSFSRFRSVPRGEFERALAPKALADAPAALLAAVDALGTAAAGPALVIHGGSAGYRHWYSLGADPSSARELHAWSDEAGAILLLAPGGEMAFAANLAPPTSVARVDPPVPGAFFTGCAFIGFPGSKSKLLILSWEGEGGTSGTLSGVIVTTWEPKGRG